MFLVNNEENLFFTWLAAQSRKNLYNSLYYADACNEWWPGATHLRGLAPG